MSSDRLSDNIYPKWIFFKYGYPHSNAYLQFRLQLERCKPELAARHPTICDGINDVNLFTDSISQGILSQFFYVFHSDVALQNQVHKNAINSFVWLFKLQSGMKHMKTYENI